MRAVDIISAKRHGKAHSRAELEFLIGGALAGEVPRYQVSAWLMAVCFQGLTPRETVDLTAVLADSGRRLDLSTLAGVAVDKHSTGGVGDKTSLVVAPLVAAAGVAVPMISGRGLGHTGGTLDKLESIPGFRVDLSPEEFRDALERFQVAVSGQTSDLAPGDRLLYALRDVTATVDCTGLIVASILSKKLAEGTQGLVLDVKTGAGAFMREFEAAEALALALVSTGSELGLNTVALITDMSQPLGRCVGNALEVAESLEVLRGEGPADLRALCLELAAHMIHLAGAADSVSAGRVRAEQLLESGEALNRFRSLIANQGGDPSIVDDVGLLPRARETEVLVAEESGFVRSVLADRIGEAAMLLGAGRSSASDPIDPAAGVRVLARIGEWVEAGDPLVKLYYDEESLLEEAVRRVRSAYQLGAEAAPVPQLIRKVCT